MKEVVVNKKQNIRAVVDDDDFEWLNTLLGWGVNTQGYAVICKRRGKKKGGGAFRSSMARLITLAPQSMDVDHIDGNPLNNQRANLRICTTRENLLNSRPKHGKRYKSTCKLKGDTYQTAINGHYIGQFPTEHIAALAYDFWAVHLHGEFARTNFQVVSYN